MARLRTILGPELDARSPSAAEARRMLLTRSEIQNGRILVLVDHYGKESAALTP